MTDKELEELYELVNELDAMRHKIMMIVGHEAVNQGYDIHLTTKGYEIKKK